MEENLRDDKLDVERINGLRIDIELTRRVI